MQGKGAWAREHRDTGHKDRVKNKDRGMGRDKNRNRDTGTVIGVGPEVKGP